jgi:FtsH-binding integral membrane protein
LTASIIGHSPRPPNTERRRERVAIRLSAWTRTRLKLAVFGAFSLYLNFINIFQLLLNFTGQREE